ncbi:MAG: S-layer homology domain-containing protein [Actinomycetota bacterium]|nr:S-layer homology domain-containing protein [Actinomycetota bacterium]
MKRPILAVALLVMMVGGLAPAAAAADLDPTWGTGGVATVPLPSGRTVSDTALLADGRVVAVGEQSGRVPWGGIVSADGTTFTTLSGFAMPDTVFNTVVTANDRIYAVGNLGLGLGISTIVAVFDLSGMFVDSHTFAISDTTVPTSAAIDAGGRLFVAGSGRGDDDGSESAWVVRLTSLGAIDSAFPTLLLSPPDTTATAPVAYVGATAGQAVAVVTGHNDPGPGSSMGFHRITETGSVFMADFFSARTIAESDIDSSSGQAVFGSLTPSTSPTAVTYLVHSLGVTGVTTQTATGNWIDAAGRIEVGRTRTDDLLGAGEADVNVFVELIQATLPFAGRPDAALVDLATAPLDGAVYLTMQDAVANALVIAKYEGDDSGRFIDDDASVHEADIERLDALGITRGCNPPVNDRYCPDLNVTRGQMAAFLKRALDLPPAVEDFFDDDNGSTFEGDINAIAAAGITRGCNPPDNDRYCPNDNVTRGQMAAFLKRAFSLPTTTVDFFVDDNGSVFEGDINAIALGGITRGCNPPDNDRYCPNDNVTRGQMASFIVRAVDG